MTFLINKYQLWQKCGKSVVKRPVAHKNQPLNVVTSESCHSFATDPPQFCHTLIATARSSLGDYKLECLPLSKMLC